MASDDLTQAPSNAVANDSTAEPFRCHKAGAKGARVTCVEHAEDQERAAMGSSFGFNPQELRRATKPPASREAIRSRLG